jgi:uncharacterized protein (UPF0332 family)
MTGKEIRSAIARNWLDKALSAFEIAEVCLEKKNLISCVNRMYYAAFYAASAILANEGKEYGKHTAVRAAINRDFIKIGRMPPEYGDYYNRLFDDRLAGDYEPATRFSYEEVRDLLVKTREFIGWCETLVSDAAKRTDA